MVDATYDNPADAQEDGGIYDEPAFNQGAEKNNVSTASPSMPAALAHRLVF